MKLDIIKKVNIIHMKTYKLNSIVSRIFFLTFTIALLCVFFVIAAIPAWASDIAFSQEEKDFLDEGKVLKAVSIDGGAPLHYKDSKGQIKGIAVSVLDEITDLTGIIFEYYLYDSISDALDSHYDVVFGLTKEYLQPGIVLSKPYLESETVLCFNKSVDPKNLDGKRYAGIEGGTLPGGIEEGSALYFNDREDTINAVEWGHADYCIGNAYSLAFYTLQNGYKNIITIPTGSEERSYCMGVKLGDEILLSIINKSIDAIDPKRMDMLILDVASQVERKITHSMLISAYGREFFILVLFVIVVLLYSVFTSISAKNRYEVENKRYQILTQVSNECLFEYHIDTDLLDISHKFSEMFDIPDEKEEITSLLKKAISGFHGDIFDRNIHTIRIPLSNGKLVVLKIVFSAIKDSSGNPFSIVGRLSDISKEEAEKEELISKSQLDGLTGLYNAITTKGYIIKSMNSKNSDAIDALIIIDCDNFKSINDNYGHLKGDLALQNISKGLRQTFRQTDIIGRIGGDEFCIYMHNITSTDFVRSKCRQLSNHIKKLNQEFHISISMGIAVWMDEVTYEELFKQADTALYQAKKDGGSQIVVYDQ